MEVAEITETTALGSIQDHADSFMWQDSNKQQCWLPEQGLMLAILKDAIECLQNTDTNRKRELARQQARAWFLDDSNAVFAFTNVCLSVGLHPDHIRRLLNENLTS